MGSDDLFEPHEVVRTGRYPIFPYTARRTPEGDQTRQRAWHLDPCKAFLPAGITDQDRQIQAQIRDMGKWPPGSNASGVRTGKTTCAKYFLT